MRKEARIEIECECGKTHSIVTAVESDVVKTTKRAKKDHSVGFESFWSVSTKRGSKVTARKYWEMLQPDTALAATIALNMALWMDSEQWQDESKQPHVSTWLGRNGWEEIIPRRYVRSRGGDIERPSKGTHPVHRCSYCADAMFHFWKCEDPEICGIGEESACPTFAAKFK